MLLLSWPHQDLSHDGGGERACAALRTSVWHEMQMLRLAPLHDGSICCTPTCSARRCHLHFSRFSAFHSTLVSHSIGRITAHLGRPLLAPIRRPHLASFVKRRLSLRHPISSPPSLAGLIPIITPLQSVLPFIFITLSRPFAPPRSPLHHPFSSSLFSLLLRSNVLISSKWLLIIHPDLACHHAPHWLASAALKPRAQLHPSSCENTRSIPALWPPGLALDTPSTSTEFPVSHHEFKAPPHLCHHLPLTLGVSASRLVLVPYQHRLFHLATPHRCGRCPFTLSQHPCTCPTCVFLHTLGPRLGTDTPSTPAVYSCTPFALPSDASRIRLANALSPQVRAVHLV